MKIYGSWLTTILFAFITFCAFPTISLADIVQSDSATPSGTGTGFSGVVQGEWNIGDNVSGTLTGIDVNVDITGGSSSGGMVVGIMDWSHTYECYANISIPVGTHGIYNITSGSLTNVNGGCTPPANTAYFFFIQLYGNSGAVSYNANGNASSVGFTATTSSGSYMANNLGSMAVPYVTFYGINGPSPANTTSRIDSVQPTPDSTNATSSPITYGAIGWVNVNDYQASSTYLRVRIAPLTANIPGAGTQGVTLLNFAQEYTLDIGSSGSFNVSSTTNIQNFGIYSAVYELHAKSYCLFGFCLIDKVLAATTTTFTMATTTALDQVALNNLAYLNVLNTASSTANTSCYFDNLGQCLVSFFVPTNIDQISYAMQTMSTALNNHLPFSFFWQSYTKLSALSASTSPTEGTDIVMHNTFIQGTTTIVSWNSAKNTIDQIIPSTTVVYLVYAEWILFSFYAIWRVLSIF